MTGGFGVENIVTASAHSTYHALQTSLAGTVGRGGPGVQASYTWSKSLDDSSAFGEQHSVEHAINAEAQPPCSQPQSSILPRHPNAGPSRDNERGG